MKAIHKTLLITALSSALFACGGSDGNDTPNAKTGQLSLALTDAPVDSLQSVVITVTGVSIKPATGDAITVTFDTPKVIDMLDLQNGVVETLLDGYQLDAGTYQWIRLELSTADGDLYVMNELGGMVGLTIPSGFQTGLKLNHEFVIAQGGDANFTIDFDLRKSMTNPNGQTNYFLKPSLRLIDNASVGTLNGEVSASLIQTACANSGEFSGLVYVFSGADVIPDDYDSTAPEALTAGKVMLDGESGAYKYSVPFLNSGNYTISYSCDLDDTAVDELLTFNQTQNISISKDTSTTVNFE